MIVGRFFGTTGRGLAAAAAIPYRYWVDDGAATRRCRWRLGWRWDQPWCRCRDRARGLCAWDRALTPLL
jgi:hypothetical protein